ncbi:MAG: TlpA disulfide reductase family protein [Gemmatimonadota bacterium]
MLRPSHTARFASLRAALLGAAVASLLACDSQQSSAGEAAVVRPSSQFDLKAYRGKVVLVNFWATWCGPCRFEIPALVELRKSFSPDQVVIVGIAIGENGSESQVKARLEKFASERGLNYPVYYDLDYELANYFNARSTFLPYVPSTLIIDQQGEIRQTHRGLPQGDGGKPDPLTAFGRDIRRLLKQS